MSRKFDIPLSYNAIDGVALAAKLNHYQDGHHSMIIKDFESGLSAVTGSRFVVGVNNGTSAIHLGLKLLGVGEGDFVIAPTFTYVASVSPVLYVNAVPVLIDCETGSWNMDPALMETAIADCISKGKKPAAIIVVHTYGMPADMDRIMAIADHHRIPVLEDAAEAIGSSWRSRALGSFGQAGVLSFNSNKILTTYGGGAVVVPTKTMADKVLFWATHSRNDKPYYEHDETGYNYRMSPVNAAVGLVQLEALTRNVEARRKIFQHYREILGRTAGAGWQLEDERSFSNRWLACMTFENGLQKVTSALADKKVETRPLWKPMHQQKLFSSSPVYLTGVSDRLFNTGICLPSSNDLSIASVDFVIRTILESVA